MRQEQFKERWVGKPVDFTKPSPFGCTSEGLQDFRGVSLDWHSQGKVTRSIYITKSRLLDISFSRIREVSFESCFFEKCRFEKTNFDGTSFLNTVFASCDFSNSAIRGNALDFWKVRFQSCQFKDAKVRKTRYQEASFTDMVFEGDTWSVVEFVNSQFERCTFVGTFTDCRFWGCDPLVMSDQIQGGMTDTDLTEAEFDFTDFRERFALQRIKLPSDRAWIVVSRKKVTACAESFSDNPEKKQAFLNLFNTLYGPSNDHKDMHHAVSLSTFQGFVGKELGDEFFALLRAIPESYDGKGMLTID